MSTPFRKLLVPRRLYEEMVSHALAERPNECCGLLAGRIADETSRDREGALATALPHGRGSFGLVVRCYPLVNALASPVEFESDGKSMFAAVRDMDKNGLDVLAIYHSHPTSAPIPSRTDLERNWWPGVVNFIISLMQEPPEVRAWWLRETDFVEAEWDVVE